MNILYKERKIQEEIQRLRSTNVGTSAVVQECLKKYGSTPLKSGTTLEELLRRPELDYVKLAEIDPKRPDLPWDVQEQVNIQVKYEGYITRQMNQVKQFKKLETKMIPLDINYEDVYSLRLEAKQKLSKIRPVSIGQASKFLVFLQQIYLFFWFI